MDVNELNLSKGRLERFLSRKRGGRSVPTTIDPLVILPEDKLKEKGNFTPFKYALKYAHLDMERWPENKQQQQQQQQQQTRKRKDSFNKENTPNLSDEHIDKLARKQRSSRFTAHSPLTSGQKFVIKPYIDNNENAKQLQTEKSSSFKRQPMGDKTSNNNNNDTLRQSSPSIQSNPSAAGSARSYRSAIKPYVDKDLQQQEEQQRRRSSSPAKQVVEEKTLNNNNTQHESSISIRSARSVTDSIRSNHSEPAHPSSTEKYSIAKSSTGATHENSSEEQQQYTTNEITIMDTIAVQENLPPSHSSKDSLHSKASEAAAAPKEQSSSVDFVKVKDSEKMSSQMEENTNDKVGTNERDEIDNNKMKADHDSSLPTLSNPKVEKSINNDIIPKNGNAPEASVAPQTDHIRDDLTDFDIEYDYGDDGGVFVGQEEEQQQQQQQQQENLADSSASISESQKQQGQRLNKEMGYSHTDYNDDNQNNMDQAQEEQLELVPLSRLPLSRQEQRRAGTVIASEFNTSKLVYNMSPNPTQEEIEIVQQNVINSFTRTAKNSKVKPMVELLKELGTIAMNCTNEVQTQNDYHQGALDLLAEVLREKFNDHAELCRKHDNLRFKSKRIKLTHDHAEKRLFNATLSRRKLSDEINEMRKKCEKLRAEREVHAKIIRFFDELNNPIPETPDDVLHEEINVIKVTNEEEQQSEESSVLKTTEDVVQPGEIDISQETTDDHQPDKSDVMETIVETSAN